MKKIPRLILKILAGLILLILISLFTIPVLFRDKIRTKVEKVLDESLNARVKFADYSLGFFKNFPNLSFSLTGLSVTGVGKFENDTLASVKSASLVFNLSSIFKKTGYEINSVLIDRASIKTLVLKDGSANWDIMKETPPNATTPAKTESSSMKIKLKKVSVTGSSISYTDFEANIQTYLNDLNLILTGDMTVNQTDLKITGRSGKFTYIMDGVKYLNNTILDADINLAAILDKMKFTFNDSYLSINDLKVNLSGSVDMPGDDITTDITFKTVQTSFSALLSLIPALYMKDFKDIKTTGEFELSGRAKGVYSDADSTMPDVSLSLSVSNASMSYPSLPEQIKNINVKTDIFFDGRKTDLSTVKIDAFHMEIAGNPIDMKLDLKTPVSDPDFDGSLSGHLDLSTISKAIPVKNMSLTGIIDASLAMTGRMSMIEKQEFEKFKASGSLGIKNMSVAMKGYPDVKINKADFGFTPAYATLSGASLKVGGKSDFELVGHIANYLPWYFRNKTLKGELSMKSKLTDASDIMSKMTTDTTAVKDTTALSVIRVPGNIDFDFDATIDEFSYEAISGKNVKGHILAKDGVLTIRDAGMDIVKGTLLLNAAYDTRDSLKPTMTADMDMKDIEIKEAFNTFNTVKKLAPASAGIDGRISAKIGFSSLLGQDMMPLINSMNGEGKLRSDEIKLVKSETFDQMKEVLKLGDKYNNTFKDVNISFRINDGRIWVNPFDVRTGNLKMNISGDQGIDQTLNYFVKTEMPRSDLGGSVNALIDNLAAQAAAFGISYKPSEILKINLKVTGTFSKPVISPVFGSSSGSGTTTSGSVTRDATKAAVDTGKEKARAEAEKEAARLVTEAEAKGQTMRDEAAKAAESIRKEADIQAKKLIDDNAKKSTVEQMAAKKGADSLKKTADKKANQLVKDADTSANKLVEEAKAKGDELIKKI